MTTIGRGPVSAKHLHLIALDTATWLKNGNKLLGIPLGSFPIRPLVQNLTKFKCSWLATRHLDSLPGQPISEGDGEQLDVA